MNNNNNPIGRFLTATIAFFLRVFATPFYYAGRSHLGVQYSALIPIIMSGGIYGALWRLHAWTSEVDARVTALHATLMFVGYFRNMIQARYRRRVRDWSVGSWSTGESLLDPVFVFCCRRLCRKYGQTPRMVRIVRTLLDDDFIYYLGEPAVLVVWALALKLIGSTLYTYPLLLAVTLIFVRSDGKLRLYLQAHEIADGKMAERAIMREFQGDEVKNGSGGIRVAQIPAAPATRAATDQRSVFDRLSPDLQLLLVRDQATRR